MPPAQEGFTRVISSGVKGGAFLLDDAILGDAVLDDATLGDVLLWYNIIGNAAVRTPKERLFDKPL